MSLFNIGKFKLHAGQTSNFKIDCDALTDNDIVSLAKIIASEFNFSEVFGIPTGGFRLADELAQYKDRYGNLLIVDDVLTTGKSFEDFVAKYDKTHKRTKKFDGVVIFARGKCPVWVTPIFELYCGFRGKL